MKLPTRTAVLTALFACTPCLAEASFDSDGTAIHYALSGKGQPVVLVHGFIGSRKEWTSPPPFLPPSEQEAFQTVFAALSEEFMVIALDCRGHGASDKPKDGDQYGLEMVEDIIRLLDHLELDKAHVVGYSMGAFLAAKLLETHTDRVQSVVLGGSGALLEGSAELAFMESLGRSLASGRGVEPLILAMTPPGAPEPTPAQIARSNAMFLAGQDEQALAKVALSHEQLTVSESELHADQVPALLIVGGNDPQKAGVEATTRLLPLAELVVLDGLDHVSTQMSPAFGKHVQSFLRRIVGNDD